MSDNTDDPSIEQVHEHIHHEAHHADQRWIAGAAVTAAILAALAAITGSLAGTYLTESSRTQIQSNDDWSLYQAKSIKAAVLRAKIELLAALSKPESSKDQEKLEQYEHDLEKTQEQAKEHAHESEGLLHRHEVLERGVTLFHIGIAIVAIAVLTKRRLFWLFSITAGAAGLVFMLQGMFVHH